MVNIVSSLTGWSVMRLSAYRGSSFLTSSRRGILSASDTLMVCFLASLGTVIFMGHRSLPGPSHGNWSALTVAANRRHEQQRRAIRFAFICTSILSLGAPFSCWRGCAQDYGPPRLGRGPSSLGGRLARLRRRQDLLHVL